MRDNLTKKNIINSVFMQIGFPKKVIEEILNDIITLIIESIKKDNKLKITNFGTFILKKKKLTTRDSRAVERKKYGRRKARRSFQFSKR